MGFSRRASGRSKKCQKFKIGNRAQRIALLPDLIHYFLLRWNYHVILCLSGAVQGMSCHSKCFTLSIYAHTDYGSARVHSKCFTLSIHHCKLNNAMLLNMQSAISNELCVIYSCTWYCLLLHETDNTQSYFSIILTLFFARLYNSDKILIYISPELRGSTRGSGGVVVVYLYITEKRRWKGNMRTQGGAERQWSCEGLCVATHGRSEHYKICLEGSFCMVMRTFC